MMSARRGVSLLGTMWLLALLVVLAGAGIVTVELVRARLVGHKQMEQATTMAVSGQDCAASLKRSGKLTPGHRYQSPDFGGGHFRLELLPNGHVLSTGCSGRSEFRLEGKL